MATAVSCRLHLSPLLFSPLHLHRQKPRCLIFLNPPIRNPNPRPLTLKAAKSPLSPSSSPSLPSKEQKMNQEGQIVEALPNCMFRVKLDNGEVILGYMAGKMQKNKIFVVPGDRVQVEIGRYDATRGRITYRVDSRVRKPPGGGGGKGKKKGGGAAGKGKDRTDE